MWLVLTMCLALPAEVYSFGTGKHGQLGLGKAVQQALAPQRITALDDIEDDAVVSVAAGGEHSLLQMQSGNCYAAVAP